MMVSKGGGDDNDIFLNIDGPKDVPDPNITIVRTLKRFFLSSEALTASKTLAIIKISATAINQAMAENLIYSPFVWFIFHK